MVLRQGKAGYAQVPAYPGRDYGGIDYERYVFFTDSKGSMDNHVRKRLYNFDPVAGR